MNLLGSSGRNQWRVTADEANLVRQVRPARPVGLGAQPQNLTIDLARTAILVIDMQNDFCHSGGWLSNIGINITPVRAPIKPLTQLLPLLRRMEIPVLWVTWGNRRDRLNLSPALLHVYKPSGRGVGLGDPLPNSGARVLEAGSWAAAIVDELVPGEDDIQIAKYRMSGFSRP